MPDTAMYRAKELKRGTYAFYDVSLGQEVLKRIKMHNSMCRAIENNEFILFYQPQVNIKTNAVCGIEALP